MSLFQPRLRSATPSVARTVTVIRRAAHFIPVKFVSGPTKFIKILLNQRGGYLGRF